MAKRKQSLKRAPKTETTTLSDSPKILRAAGYVRVSQERNMVNGYGLEAQFADVERYVAYRKWGLIRIYEEKGASGYLPAASQHSKENARKGTRAVLDELLRDAGSGAFDVVVFPSIDRAARSVLNMIEIDDALRKVNVSVVFIREGIDTSTAMGEFFRNICASIAQFEGELMYERLINGRKVKKARGGYVGGFIPYGYRSEKKALVIVPEEAEVVRLIFALRLQGKTHLEITKELNARGIKPSRGGLWRKSTIGYMLNRPVYAGYLRRKGGLIRGSHEPIIDVKTFNAAQRVFHSAARRRLYKRKRIKLPVVDKDFESESKKQTE